MESYKLFTIKGTVQFESYLNDMTIEELRKHMFFAHGYIREVELASGHIKP